MPRSTLALLLLAGSAVPAFAQDLVPFRPGMTITGSTRIAPGTYRTAAPASLDSALIVIQGDDIMLDLTDVNLVGLDPEADPDQAAGVAIRIDGGRGVTVRGATIRGYRFAVLARGTQDLRLLDNELSYGWKPRLFSVVARESIVDWLSYHDNEEREWMRYGAAVYLEEVQGGEIRDNRAVQGMNGLLMTRTDSVTVRDNDFRFNSGLGVGLYRSSHNTIVRNLLDYDVRGYSHGVYQRGQDSAGLLLYEQSSHNVIAYNSATHSGDGLFLWAGRSTMDSGQGGANDNLIFYNDFSFAPTNAVEVTFSRNRIVGNVLGGSRYGVWGGYSWATTIEGNCLSGNVFGVAIEHGQDNRIVENRFDGDSLAISLWSRESEPSDWGYPRNRDTRSRNHAIEANEFAGTDVTWRFQRTAGVVVAGNRWRDAIPAEPCRPRELLGPTFDSIAAGLIGEESEIPTWNGARLPRAAIVVDEWGPFDGRSPKLWPVDTARSAVRLAVLGPPGRWRLVGREGVAGVSLEGGSVGDTLVVSPAPERVGDWRVSLEYAGEPTVSPRGRERAAGEAVPFAFERFDPELDWAVRFFRWDGPEGDPPADSAAWDALFAGEPFLLRSEPRLAYVWFRPLIPEVPSAHWALEGEATVVLPPGEYSLRTISDDGVRVWVDGGRVVDHWEPHGSAVDYAALSGGRHEVLVRYYQLTGWAELRVDVVRGSGRSQGSPGPH